MQEALHAGASSRLLDLPQVVADPTRSGEVPFQLAFGSGVREVLQGGVHLPQKTPEALEELGGVGPRRGEDRPRHVRQHPDQTSVRADPLYEICWRARTGSPDAKTCVS